MCKSGNRRWGGRALNTRNVVSDFGPRQWVISWLLIVKRDYTPITLLSLPLHDPGERETSDELQGHADFDTDLTMRQCCGVGMTT